MSEPLRVIANADGDMIVIGIMNTGNKLSIEEAKSLTKLIKMKRENTDYQNENGGVVMDKRKQMGKDKNGVIFPVAPNLKWVMDIWSL